MLRLIDNELSLSDKGAETLNKPCLVAIKFVTVEAKAASLLRAFANSFNVSKCRVHWIIYCSRYIRLSSVAS